MFGSQLVLTCAIARLLTTKASHASQLALSMADNYNQTSLSVLEVFQPGVDFAPTPLPDPIARSKGDEIVDILSKVDRDTPWKLIDTVDLSFGEYAEPEGIVRIGDDRYVVSYNVYQAKPVKLATPVKGYDRTAGSGFGYLGL